MHTSEKDPGCRDRHAPYTMRTTHKLREASKLVFGPVAVPADDLSFPREGRGDGATGFNVPISVKRGDTVSMIRVSDAMRQPHLKLTSSNAKKVNTEMSRQHESRHRVT